MSSIAGGKGGSRRNAPGPIRNVFSNWGAFLFAAVANFFLAPFVVHSLGPSAYGAWVLLGSTVGYLGLLDLGVRSAVMRFVARLHATGDHKEAGHFASAGLMFFGASSTVAVVAGFVLAGQFARWFEIPAALLGEARIAVVLVALTIAASLMTGVYGGIVIAMQRFDLNSGAEIVIEALRVVAVVAVLSAGETLVGLALVQLGAGLLRFAFAYVMSRRSYPELQISIGGWDGTHLKQILGYSAAATALTGASMVIFQLDSLVIGASLPVAMVSYFAIAGTLCQYGKAAVDGISYTIPPRVSAQEGEGNIEGARLTALLGGKLATLIHLPIIVTFIIRGETFIRLWMGPEYALLAGRVLWILSIGYWFIGGRTVIVTTLMGLNRHRILVPAAWAEAAVNVTVSLLLVGSYGIIGVAWGTTLPAVLNTTIVYAHLFSSAMSIPIWRVWRQIWLLPSLGMVPFAIASFAVEHLFAPSSLILFFVQVAGVLLIAVLGGWWIACTEEERRAFRGHLPRKLRTVAVTST